MQSITLQDIWSSPVDRIQEVLATQGRTLGNNLNSDKVKVAQIYLEQHQQTQS